MNVYCLRIHPSAELDIQHARDCYNMQTEDLGNEFMSEIEQTISQIMRNPKQFPKYIKTIEKPLSSVSPIQFILRLRPIPLILMPFSTTAEIRSFGKKDLKNKNLMPLRGANKNQITLSK